MTEKYVSVKAVLRACTQTTDAIFASTKSNALAAAQELGVNMVRARVSQLTPDPRAAAAVRLAKAFGAFSVQWEAEDPVGLAELHDDLQTALAAWNAIEKETP